MERGLKNGMHKPVVTVTLEGDAAEVLAFCQRLDSLKLQAAAITAVVKRAQGGGYVDYTFVGVRDGSAEESLRNIAQLERQCRIGRADADELADLLRAFAQLQK